MNRIRAAFAWITSSRQRAALAATMAVGIVLVGAGFAIAVNGIAGPPAAAQPSMSAATEAAFIPTPSPTASPSEVPTPTVTPSPRPSRTPSPTVAPAVTAAAAEAPLPTPAATPAPTAAPPMPMPTPAPTTRNAAEEACVGFAFADAPITVSTLAELEGGMLGTWAGCVTTPWVSPYWVTITFRADGTYSGRAMAGSNQPAFYYGTDDDSSEKVYAVNDFQDSLKGIGQIDIVFWPGNTNRGDLRNIKLMGDQLEFEFFHRAEYGPLTYQLYRLDAPTE